MGRRGPPRAAKLRLIVSFIRDNRGSNTGPKVGREQRKQRLYGGAPGRRDNERVTKEVMAGVTSGQGWGVSRERGLEVLQRRGKWLSESFIDSHRRDSSCV